MISYNVFFSPKAGVEVDRVLAAAHGFLDALKAEKRIHGYRILRVTNPASFPDLPQLQAIVDYDCQGDLDASFAFMRDSQRMDEGAHGELITLVTDFRVSFTADV